MELMTAEMEVMRSPWIAESGHVGLRIESARVAFATLHTSIVMAFRVAKTVLMRMITTHVSLSNVRRIMLKYCESW